MIAQPYDWNKKEIIDLESFSNLVLDFTKWWIECKLEKLVAPANGFTYRLLGHRPLRDERLEQIFEWTIEERGTDAGASSGVRAIQCHPKNICLEIASI